MNTKRIFAPWLLMVAALLLAGCGDGTPEQATDPHAGHDHGPGEHGQAASHGEGDWCTSHNIAESACFYCNPNLVEDLGWCAGHDMPEALCWICNPALEAAYTSVGDWCVGHGLPESRCLICNPHLAEEKVPAGGHAAEEAASLPRYQQAPEVTCTKHQVTVNFARDSIAQEAGFQTAAVEVRPVSRTLECAAMLDYDRNRYARITPQVGGLVQEVRQDLGARVEAGDVLAVIVSPAFGAAKAAYLQALASETLWQRNHDREEDLLQRGVATERDLLEAETQLAESRIAVSRARQELLGLGLTEAMIEEVERAEDTGNAFPLVAPFTGVVVDRMASVGEFSGPSEPLLAVADVERLWAWLDIYETDIPDVRAGSPVVLHIEGMEDQAVAGTLTWVGTELDARTRTLRARAELPNPGGLLRANMFARAEVKVRDAEPTVVVPREAVQWEGCCNVVFVQEDVAVYQPVKVHLGPAAGSLVEVRRGLRGGEVVVTQGSFLLKTEILKGSIGAGCCEAHPGS